MFDYLKKKTEIYLVHDYFHHKTYKTHKSASVKFHCQQNSSTPNPKPTHKLIHTPQVAIKQNIYLRTSPPEYQYKIEIATSPKRRHTLRPARLIYDRLNLTRGWEMDTASCSVDGGDFLLCARCDFCRQAHKKFKGTAAVAISAGLLSRKKLDASQRKETPHHFRVFFFHLDYHLRFMFIIDGLECGWNTCLVLDIKLDIKV